MQSPAKIDRPPKRTTPQRKRAKIADSSDEDDDDVAVTSPPIPVNLDQSPGEAKKRHLAVVSDESESEASEKENRPNRTGSTLTYFFNLKFFKYSNVKHARYITIDC